MLVLVLRLFGCVEVCVLLLLWVVDCGGDGDVGVCGRWILGVFGICCMM